MSTARRRCESAASDFRIVRLMPMQAFNRRRAALAGGYGLLTALFCARLFEFPTGLGVYDWDQHFFYYGSVLKSVVEYGQLPFWNPWYCGGNVLWQNPQVALLSPAYPLALLMPLSLAMKVNIALHYWVGFVGMHLLLTRVIGLSFLPLVVYLGSVFTLSGAPAFHLLAGHSNFLPIFYLPMLLFFVCQAVSRGRVADIAGAAASLGLMLVNGGPHIVPVALIALGAFTACAAATRQDWRPLAAILMIGAGGLALAAPKLLPVTLLVTSDPFQDVRNAGVHPDLSTPEMMLRVYLDAYQHPGLRVGPVRHAWFEYGNYIGLPAVILTGASLLWIVWSRHESRWWMGASLAAAIVALIAWSAGEFGVMAPYSLTRQLPLFSNFNVPSRYTVAVPLFAAACIGFVARALGRHLQLTRPLGIFATAACVLATGDLIVQNGRLFNKVFSLAPVSQRLQALAGESTLSYDSETSPFAPNSPMFRALVANRSPFECYEGIRVRRTAVVGAPLVAADAHARLFDVEFSPNRVAFGVASDASGSSVTLNENFANGWSSTAGAVIAGATGRPTVKVAPGAAGRFAFEYAPPGLPTGVGMFVAAVCVFAWGWRRRVWPPRRSDVGDRAPGSGLVPLIGDVPPATPDRVAAGDGGTSEPVS